MPVRAESAAPAPRLLALLPQPVFADAWCLIVRSLLARAARRLAAPG